MLTARNQPTPTETRAISLRAACACCGDLFARSEDETECLPCATETAALLALPGRCELCGHRNYLATDSVCAACSAPARRNSDVAETAAAAPSEEALAQGRMLHGLRTNLAVLSGALLGVML